jgi:predicted nuclease of restriction endonuclease-like (RecB) superfamily
VWQLDHEISTQFFERTVRSKNQAAMLARGQEAQPEDAISLEDEVRDPYLLEFLNLKDEYSESELEEALVRHLLTTCI